MAFMVMARALDPAPFLFIKKSLTRLRCRAKQHFALIKRGHSLDGREGRVEPVLLYPEALHFCVFFRILTFAGVTTCHEMSAVPARQLHGLQG